jgi:drug/metabolite transporter (DMT)-like permease
MAGVRGLGDERGWANDPQGRPDGTEHGEQRPPDPNREPSTRTSRRHTAVAAILIVVATIVFTISDVTTKVIADTIPTFEIVWFRYVAFVAFAFALLARRPSIPVHRTRNLRLQILRGIAAFGSAALFIASLIFLPVGDATAINYVSPLMVTGLSAWWLREHVGIKCWIATSFGFVGVLLIMQPGSASFQWQAILPVLAALCWAWAMVFTRRMSSTEPAALTMAYTAVIGLLAASVIVPFEWVTPSPHDWLMIVIVGITATMGHALFVIAFGYAAASLLAPLSYIQIVWATLLGYVVFGDAPGFVAVLGMVLVVASGVYVAWFGDSRAADSSGRSQS